ncbi:MAG: RNA polymerase sigma factor [Phycisphaerales bacterium]|nr:RNA polymerase sigma factor [Phycisphaerales bacterium]
MTAGPDFTSSQLSRDEQLMLERLRAQDRVAVAAIEKRYGDELRLFCRRMLNDADAGDDIVQDVMATCCRLDAESLPQRSIRGWLYQVARRKCIDARRKRHDSVQDARGVRDAQRSYANAVDPLTTPAGRALKRDRAAKILQALDEMEDDLRDVVLMRYFQDLPREEIAEAIGLSLAGAKARLARAMTVLRDKLGGLGDLTGHEL